MAKSKNLMELEAQAEFQRERLEELRGQLEGVPYTLKSFTAAGAPRVYENPEWTAYEKLLKSYHATLRAITAQTGNKSSEKKTGIGSPLQNFRGKYNGIEVVKSA